MEKGKEMTTDRNIHNTMEATKETMKWNPKPRVSKNQAVFCYRTKMKFENSRNAWWD